LLLSEDDPELFGGLLPLVSLLDPLPELELLLSELVPVPPWPAPLVLSAPPLVVPVLLVVEFIVSVPFGKLELFVVISLLVPVSKLELF